MSKAFSPSTRIDELETTEGTVYQYIHKLQVLYHAKNERHLVYLRYKRKENPKTRLLATKRELEVLAGIVVGKSYDEIAQELGMLVTTVITHVGNLVSRNKCHDADELVVIYADWEMQHGKEK